jgi:hypothetical protein
MAWHSDFSVDSACLQYFWNPGSEMSAILVYTQIYRLFVALHSTVHSHCRAANFTETTFTKPELAVNILHKVKFI